MEKVQLVLRYLLYFLLVGALIDLALFVLFVWTGDLVLATLPFSHLVLEGISFILIRMVRSTIN